MPDISKITIEQSDYNVKDNAARTTANSAYTQANNAVSFMQNQATMFNAAQRQQALKNLGFTVVGTV